MNEHATCREIATEVSSQEVTARSVVDGALERAERYQDKWRAFIRIAPDAARRQAERVDALIDEGKRLPLAGVPFAVKDLIDIKGLPTTAGSRALAKRVARADAQVVRRLVDAGAVPLGKLNMHECAFGFTGENPTYGNTKNPFNAERITGGSSSGSAAVVALGICPLSLGSDTGGSIRQPSALCNLVGLKPTYGRVSRAGVTPLAWSLDHVGPMVRTAEDAALVLGVLAGHDLADEATTMWPVPSYTQELVKPPQGLRMGIPGSWFFGALEPDVSKAVDTAIKTLTELGIERVEVKLPHLDEVVGAHRAIIFSEASSYYQPYLAERAEQFGDDIRPLLEGGLFMPAVDYLKGQRARRVIRSAWAKVFADIDLLVTPTTPIVATHFGQQTAKLPGGEKPLVRAYLDLTLPFNLSGHPALSVPCGFSQDGLPIGLQMVGRPFDEGTILLVAHHYQQQTDWHRRMAKVVQ